MMYSIKLACSVEDKDKLILVISSNIILFKFHSASIYKAL